jgi:hypothetical protein
MYGTAGSPTVTVAWVAGTDQGAARLVAAVRDTRAEIRPVDAGDEAFQLDPQAGTVTARVGRYVISVTARQPGEATRLAQAAVARLRTA